MSTDLVVPRPMTAMDLLDRLSRAVTDPQAAVEIAKQIVDLQVRQEQLRQSAERFEWEKYERDARVAFAEAFKQFKEEAPKILRTKHVFYEGKDASKPATSYWHVELDKACDLLIPALLKVGITHRWKSADLPGGMTRVTCFLRHRLGYEEEGASLAGPADQSGGKNPIQGVGSSTSYLERYTFLATCGIVPANADNDGATDGQFRMMDENALLEWTDAIKEAPDDAARREVFLKALTQAQTVKCVPSEIDLDCAFLKHAATLTVAKQAFEGFWKRWKADSNQEARNRIRVEFEAAKRRLQ